MHKVYFYFVFLFAVALCALPLGLYAQSPAYAQGPSAFSDPGASSGGGGGGSGSFAAVEGSVDGGTVPIGATAQVVIRFRNDGGQPIQTGLIRLYPSSTVSATIALNQCESDGPITPGAECAVALSVKGLQAGAWRVEMLMSHSGRSRLVTATLSGVVETTGEGSDKMTSDLEAIPDEVDFGTLNASQRLVEPIILRNITSIPITISDIYIDASEQAGYSLNTECEMLSPGQACIAVVSWSPKLRGPASGVLVVKHDGPASLTSVALKGEYTPDSVDQAEVFPEAVPGRGLLVSSQTELDFGDEVSSASTITVSLVNAGDTDLTINKIALGGADSGLSFKGTGCKEGQVLEPVEACPLTVSWSPTRVGLLVDDIQIAHDGARGVLVLPVRGESEGAVSQDQGAIVMSSGEGLMVSPGMSLPIEDLEGEDADDDDGGSDPSALSRRPARQPRQQSRRTSQGNFIPVVANPASVLDGLKITSFSPTRAIVSGPSGSRIVFNREEIVLGGIPWDVNIQRNGIEFTHAGQTVLLLFDRSLSSVNRVDTSSDSDSGSSSSSSSSSDSE